jgi:hypothetical protein
MIEGIPADDYMRFRSNILPFLMNFAERSFTGGGAAGLESDILSRTRQVWKIGDWQALALTTVEPDAVVITHCAGSNREDWQEALDAEIETWARALGKSRIAAHTRPGWAKLAKTLGYRETHRTFVKEIADA